MYKSLDRNSEKEMLIGSRLNQSMITDKQEQMICNHHDEIAELKKICD